MKLKLFSNRFLMVASLLLATCVYAQAQTPTTPQNTPQKKIKSGVPGGPATPNIPGGATRLNKPAVPNTASKVKGSESDVPEVDFLPETAEGASAVQNATPRTQTTGTPRVRPSRSARTQQGTTRRTTTTRPGVSPKQGMSTGDPKAAPQTANADMPDMLELAEEEAVEEAEAVSTGAPKGRSKAASKAGRANKRPAVRNKADDNTVGNMPEMPQATAPSVPRTNKRPGLRGRTPNNTAVKQKSNGNPLEPEVIEEEVTEDESVPVNAMPRVNTARPTTNTALPATNPARPTTTTKPVLPRRGTTTTGTGGTPIKGQPLETENAEPEVKEATETVEE